MFFSFDFYEESVTPMEMLSPIVGIYTIFSLPYFEFGLQYYVFDQSIHECENSTVCYSACKFQQNNNVKDLLMGMIWRHRASSKQSTEEVGVRNFILEIECVIYWISFFY
jgi:hypothetical protein